MKRNFHPKSASARLAEQNERVVRPRITPPPVESLPTPRVLGPQALNTHFFDGKIGNLLPYLHDDIQRASLLDKNEAFTVLQKMIDLATLTLKARNNIIRCLKRIINSYRIHGRTEISPNYDSINKLYACDLLFLLYEKIYLEHSEDHFSLLLAQLDEMATGTCSQGRVTRLFQILIMLRTDID